MDEPEDSAASFLESYELAASGRDDRMIIDDDWDDWGSGSSRWEVSIAKTFGGS